MFPILLMSTTAFATEQSKSSISTTSSNISEISKQQDTTNEENNGNRWVENNTTDQKTPEDYQKTPADFYATVTNKGVDLYTEKEQKIVPEDKTYRVKYTYQQEGETYYSLYDNNNQWQGCVKSTEVKKSDSPWGAYEEDKNYLQIQNKNYKMYNNQSWNSPYTASKYYQKTLKVQKIYHHFNGDTYYSLYDNQNKWKGYVNKKATQIVSTPWGNAIDKNGYVSITNANYSLYNNKEWNTIGKTSKYNRNTVKVKKKYNHYNGNTYYSLYNKDDKWLGYVNTDAIKEAENSWGIKWNKTQYATVVNSNYNVYRSRNFDHKVSLDKYKNKTIKVTGYYKHINGEVYYSIENNSGQWIGYVNAKALKLADTAWGSKQNKISYISVTSNNYKIYSNKEWKSTKTTKGYYKKTLKVIGQYHHFNGETYYSVENNKKDWIGYVNVEATAQTTPQGKGYNFGDKTMQFSKKGYDIYGDLSDFSPKKGTSTQYMNQGINVKWAYHHFNGETYYSLYNKDDKWLGYVNSDSMKYIDQVSVTNSVDTKDLIKVSKNDKETITNPAQYPKLILKNNMLYNKHNKIYKSHGKIIIQQFNSGTFQITPSDIKLSVKVMNNNYRVTLKYPEYYITFDTTKEGYNWLKKQLS